MNNTVKKFNGWYFVIGLFFIFVATLSFKDPASDLLAIVLFFAISAILKGIFELSFRKKLQSISNKTANTFTFLGILDLLIGIFLMFNLNASLVALPYVFASWFIIDSIGEIFAASIFSTTNKGFYWFTVIINILGIIVGVMLLFNPLSSALTLAFLVGMYFMMTGINFIISAFN